MIKLFKNTSQITPKNGTTIHIGHCHTLPELYTLLATELDFPDYFGHNLDALFDCLCELPELPLPFQIVIENTPQFLENEDEENREELFCLLDDVASTWLQEKGEHFFEVWVQDFEDSNDFFELLLIKTE